MQKKMKNNDTLTLTIKKKWFDMIASGLKKEDYRELKQYWLPRLVEERNDNGNHTFRKYKYVKFVNVYSKNSTTCTLVCEGITTGIGKSEWGATEDYCFIIKLGDIIQPTKKTDNEK